MSEKDKVKVIKVTKFERKLLIAEQNEFNELMNLLGKKLQAFRERLEKARIEEIAEAHNITEAYQDGEWLFDTGKHRFIKQDKVTPPPDPPPPPPGQEVTPDTPGGKKKKLPGKTH